jgi:hypothetical protein
MDKSLDAYNKQKVNKHVKHLNIPIAINKIEAAKKTPYKEEHRT